jgi:hypothetical protein
MGASRIAPGGVAWVYRCIFIASFSNIPDDALLDMTTPQAR